MMKNNPGEAIGRIFSSRALRILFERVEFSMALLNKHIWLPAILVPLLIFFALSIANGQEGQLVLNNPDAFPTRQRSAVTFPHELHMDTFDCLECHHDYVKGENVLDEGELEEGNPVIRCTSCHHSASRPDLRHAYHFQCMGCHRRMRIEGQATGPELCGECHIK